jgi:ADP-heptose:LPS heptosyltransferase
MSAKRPELSFAVFGAPSDMRMALEIVKGAGAGASVYDLTGRTSIGELAEALRLCSVAISNDSGPMHVAAAVGTPLLALFGPTDPALTGPRAEKAVVLRPDIDCIGCMKRYCQKGLCQVSLDPGSAAGNALDLLKWRN